MRCVIVLSAYLSSINGQQGCPDHEARWRVCTTISLLIALGTGDPLLLAVKSVFYLSATGNVRRQRCTIYSKAVLAPGRVKV